MHEIIHYLFPIEMPMQKMQQIIIGGSPIDATQFAILINQSSVLANLFSGKWKESSGDITIEDDIDWFHLAIEFYQCDLTPLDELTPYELALFYEFSRKWVFINLENELCDRQMRYFLSKSSKLHCNKFITIMDTPNVIECINRFSELNEMLKTIPRFDHSTYEGRYNEHGYHADCSAIINNARQPLEFPHDLEYIGINSKYLIFKYGKYLVYRENLSIQWTIIKYDYHGRSTLTYHACSRYVDIGSWKSYVDKPYEHFVVKNGVVAMHIKFELSVRVNKLLLYLPSKNHWAVIKPVLIHTMHLTDDSIVFDIPSANVYQWYKITFEYMAQFTKYSNEISWYMAGSPEHQISESEALSTKN
jgi:hypothetical protein